ncbi:MAG: hypothetical protein ACLFSL_02070 [Candidatus Woesearchaeota archaeon]
MEICNEVAGSYKIPSSKKIAATMKLMDKKSEQADTSKKVSRYLQKAISRKSTLSTALKSVYKVHEMYTKTNIIRERRYRRANRMTIIHPSKIADGNYNS